MIEVLLGFAPALGRAPDQGHDILRDRYIAGLRCGRQKRTGTGLIQCALDQIIQNRLVQRTCIALRLSQQSDDVVSRSLRWRFKIIFQRGVEEDVKPRLENDLEMGGRLQPSIP